MSELSAAAVDGVGFSSADTDVGLIGRVLTSVPGADLYSSGLVSSQADAAMAMASVATAAGTQPLLHLLDLDLAGVDPLQRSTLKDGEALARGLNVSWVTTDLEIQTPVETADLWTPVAQQVGLPITIVT